MRILCNGCRSPSTTEVLFPALETIAVGISVTIAVVVASTRLGVTLPHTNIAANSNPAALVGNCLAELCTLHKTGELLCAVDTKWFGPDVHPEVNTGGKIAINRLCVEILLLLGGLEQAEGQAVKALVADRKIGKDEVAGFSGTVEIGHTRGGHTGQNRWVAGSGCVDTAAGDGASMLETGVEEEVGIVVKCDVLALLNSESLNNSKLNNRGRIDRSAVAVGLHTRTTGSGTLWLLQNGHLIPEAAVFSCDSVKSGDTFALGIDGDCGRCRHVGY
jgi:hypothetical protein